MLKFVRGMLQVSLVSCLAACAADQADLATGSDEVRACSQANGPCGGFVVNAPTCCPGYECQLNAIPDTGGVCVRTTHQNTCVCTLLCVQGTTQHCNHDGTCSCR